MAEPAARRFTLNIFDPFHPIEDERALPVSATEKETAMPTDDGWPPAFQYIISDFLHVPVTCVIRRERLCELLHM
jgi:hypothetical protein